MANISLTVDALSISLQHTPILTHCQLKLIGPQWVAILGKSGVGKSILFRHLAGLKTEQAVVQGCILANHSCHLHQYVAYMAQADLLLPWLNALENIMLAQTLGHQQPNRDRAHQLLAAVGLAQYASYYPHQLSGGMRQRIALARTLFQDKPIVLLDEPFSALDAFTRRQLQDLALNLLHDKLVLFITHDPQEAIYMAGKIYLLAGRPAKLQCLHEMSQLDDHNALEKKLWQQLMALENA